MSYLEYTQKLEFMLDLINQKRTGSPAELANRLVVSEKTIRRMVNVLRSKGFDIRYDRSINSYFIQIER